MHRKEVSDEQQVLEIKYLEGVWNCKAELIPDGERYNHKNKTKLHAAVLQHAGEKNTLLMQRQCTTSCPRTHIW